MMYYIHDMVKPIPHVSELGGIFTGHLNGEAWPSCSHWASICPAFVDMLEWMKSQG